MAVFEYRGILVSTGKSVEGVRDAENQKTLRTALRKDGIMLTAAKEEAEAKEAKKRAIDLSRLFDRVSVGEVAMMTRQLSTLVRAKVPLFEALSALIEQVEKEPLRRALTNIRDQVREGTSFADALGAHPKLFSGMYVNMVRAGEASGTLEQVLARVTDFMENQAKLQGKVVGAMVYPILMLFIAISVVGVLMVAVVPKMTAIFKNMNRALPWYTSMLISVSEFAASYWWLVTALCVLAFIVFSRWKRTEEGKLRWHAFLLGMPLFGKLIQMVAISRFARTLATLLSAGVALLQAMDIVRAVLGNAELERVVKVATGSIREGQSIAAPLKASGRFPPLVTHMIAIGEKSGELEAMLENVADAYDTAVDNRVQVITRLLEPLIIVVAGGMVAFIALSFIFPLTQMSSFAG